MCCWIYPPTQDSSDHQDDSLFLVYKGSQPQPSFAASQHPGWEISQIYSRVDE